MRILKILLLTQIFLSIFSKISAQHDDEKTRVFIDLSFDNYVNANDNLKSLAYYYSFDNMLNHNDFDFYSPSIRLGWGFGISFPFENRWTYEMGFQTSGATTKITYLDSVSTEVNRKVKFRTMNFNFIGINYLVGNKHLVGFNLPLTSGRILYKSEGVNGEEDGYKTVSTKKLLTHFLSIDLDLHYQINLNKRVAIRISKYFSLFGGDQMFGNFDMLYMNNGRNSASLLLSF